jgi:hypothetical protein
MISMKAKIKLFFCLHIVFAGTDGFSEEPGQKAENIQSPQLRKETSQLRAVINQPNAEWKLIGFSEKHKTRSDMIFYDSSSVEILENGILRLWIKDVKASTIKKNENDFEIISKSAETIAEGYVPPCMKVNKSKFGDADAHEIILFETIANLRRNQPGTMMQNEIDMKNLKYRNLLIRIYKPNGTIETSANKLIWNKIEPGSNFEILYKILMER